MFSLQRLLGKEDRFFDLLESSAEEARGSVQLLVKLLNTPDQTRSLDEFAQTRRKDKRITEQITEELCTTFITPLEREDIEALSSALYKIPKTVEKFGERLLLLPPHLRAADFSRQAVMLAQATDTLLEMVKELRSHREMEKVRDQNVRLQRVEGEADKLIVELLRDLYGGKHDPLKVVALRDLYELLEKVVDRCRDAGNIIFQIALKHS